MIFSSSAQTADDGPVERGTIYGQTYNCFSCSNAIIEAESSWNMDVDEDEEPTEEEIEAAIRKAQQKFCRVALREVTDACVDAGVGYATSPGITPDWQGNGCGTGGGADYFAEAVAGAGLFPGLFYTQDEPARGHSFREACNRHDMCYGLGEAKDRCDTDFKTDMQQACSSNEVCNSFAGTYWLAVRSYHGINAYLQAGKERYCAKKLFDSKENGCGLPMIF